MPETVLLHSRHWIIAIGVVGLQVVRRKAQSSRRYGRHLRVAHDSHLLRLPVKQRICGAAIHAAAKPCSRLNTTTPSAMENLEHLYSTKGGGITW